MSRRRIQRRTHGRSLFRASDFPLALRTLAAGVFCLFSMHAWAGSGGPANPAGAAADASATAAHAGPERGDADISFDRSLLSAGGSNTDALDRFEHGNPVLPGIYSVDLYINTTYVGRANVRFSAPSGSTNATPCMTEALLEQMRLHPKLTSAQQASLADPRQCVALGDLVDGASMQFDLGNLRLDASVPQASMPQLPRGYVAPQNLDHGVTSGVLNYNFNSYHIDTNGLSQTSSYLNLDAGFNLDGWHLRHKSALTWVSAAADKPARHQWQSIETYVSHDLPALHAQATIGDSYTSGDLFDSIGIRGVQIATDDRMLPESERGYAPIVRGVAESNAKVVIRQNGVLLYQTTVAPGPFVIRDLYPTGYGGDLDVEVTEANGRVHSFKVPYASVAQLLRPKTTRFSVAIGDARNPALVHKQLVYQGTLQHGFDNLFTGYAGAVGARGYFAMLVGGAFNTRLGAFALDMTRARTKIPGVDTLTGNSLRLTYSKTISATDTSFSVAAYRYSTRGYLGLDDALLARDYARRGLNVFASGAPTINSGSAGSTIPGLIGASGFAAATEASGSASAYTGGLDRMRNRFNLSLSQQLGQNSGSLFVNASINDYWNRSQHDTQFQVGYNNHFHAVGYSVSATRTRDPLGRVENQYFASINIALGDSPHAPSLSANFGRTSEGDWQEQATLNGSAGAYNQFNYGATASHDGGGAGSAVSVDGAYRSPYAIFNASAGQGRNYNQASLGISGAVVAHPGGITLGEPTGDTVGVVVAKHAEGARVSSTTGSRVDSAGYALVPYLNPYNLNTVTLDPKGLPLDVQLDSTSAQVAPHAGSVVMIRFKTEYGRSMIVRVRLADGAALPFGAEVTNAQGSTLGVVGQGGQVLVRGAQASGQLMVHWTDDNGAEQGCDFHYTLPDTHDAHAYAFMDAICKKPATTGDARS